MTNIEVVDLGPGDDNDNSLALSLEDLLDLVATSGGTGLSANGDDIDLFIAGDADGAVRDNLSLVGGWTESGTFTSSTVTGTETTFMLFTAAGSQVAVQEGLDLIVA